MHLPGASFPRPESAPRPPGQADALSESCLQTTPVTHVPCLVAHVSGPQSQGAGPLLRALQPAPSNSHGTLRREGLFSSHLAGVEAEAQRSAVSRARRSAVRRGHRIHRRRCGRSGHTPRHYTLSPTLSLLGHLVIPGIIMKRTLCARPASLCGQQTCIQAL